MTFGRLIGLGLLTLGVVLLIVGFTSTDSIANQTSKIFSGEYTQGTMWLLIGGAISSIFGLGLALFAGPRASQ